MQMEQIALSPNSYLHRTLDLATAANFLGIHMETLRQRAAGGEIPGAKVGKCWRFLEADLVNYLRSLYSGQASQGVHRREKIWHSTKEIKSIGFLSATTEKEYNAALGLTTK
jgi:excisionase family DNA binding protein